MATLLLLFLWIVPPGLRAWATTVVPVEDDALLNQAAAIVTGVVKSIESHWDPQARQILTHITISLEEVLKGEIEPGDLTIRQLGGSVGDRHSWIHGSPEFVLGERVLLFLGQHGDGALRVLHGYQGKFSVRAEQETGEEFAHRHRPRGVHQVVPPGSPPRPGEDVRPFREFRDRIREFLRRQGHGRSRHRGTARMISAPPAPSTIGQARRAFVLPDPPVRWFEADEGAAVPIRINVAGEPAAPGNGFAQVREALSAWSTVAGSSFRYQEAGFTDSVGMTSDGINAISFRDPRRQIDDPVNCTGTLGETAFLWTTGESRIINGQSFFPLLEADVVVNDGWDGCGFYESFRWFAELVTHELGHALGLDHSPDQGATMFPTAHNDGRGASLRADDIAGLLRMYPVPATVALSLNQPSFRSAQTLTLAATVTPGATPPLVDAYVAVEIPGGTLLFLQGDGSLATEVRPIVSNWTVSPLSGEIFRYTFGGGEPPGGYTWYAAFTQPGTWSFIGPIVSTPFSFSP